MTDYKQLCAELLSELENAIRVIYREDGTRHISSADPVIAKADAALAEPEPEGPTDQELLRLYKVATPCHAVEEYTRELDFARAVLARWGRPAPEPQADGEVADLVLFLKENAEDALADECPIVAGQFTRAADLLERLASPACLVVNPPPEAVQALKAAGPGRIELMPADPPQPVPVSERLPGVLCRRRT